MARPKSDDKKNAILAAAATVFAERGLIAPTSAISSAAGVAEGTLFTYFKNKDDLVNALYCQIKQDLGTAMLTDFPRKPGGKKETVQKRLHHIWDKFIDWGMSNPAQRVVLRKIDAWDCLTPESKNIGQQMFPEVKELFADASSEKIINNIPQKFIGAMMSAQAEITIDFMKRAQSEADTAACDDYRELGFEMLWAGISCRK